MTDLHLLVVLQTHSVASRDNSKARYCGASKAEIMRRCVTSLVDSLNHAVEAIPYLKVQLQVLDDHSDAQSFDMLTAIVATAKFNHAVTSLETRGIMPSILACYEYGKAHGQELVYFVQDDYLYELNAIRDMVFTWLEMSHNLSGPVNIFPFNDPYHYIPVNTQIQSHIVQSNGRHWRTQILTSSCFMTHINILKKEWDLFYKMGTSKLSPTMENDSINQLFRLRGYYLFVPIPSLALHMQFETERDPYINWQEWWSRYDEQERIQT